MNDGSVRFCDICGNTQDVRYYRSIDLDICGKCLPMFGDMLDGKLHVNGDVQNNNSWRSGAAVTTATNND